MPELEQSRMDPRSSNQLSPRGFLASPLHCAIPGARVFMMKVYGLILFAGALALPTSLAYAANRSVSAAADPLTIGLKLSLCDFSGTSRCEPVNSSDAEG